MLTPQSIPQIAPPIFGGEIPSMSVEENWAAAHVAPAPENGTASSYAGGTGGLMAIIGAILCATPIAPVGVAMLAFGGIVWLLAPATAPGEQRIAAEVEAGNSGCGAFVAVMGLIVIIVLLAGMVAIAAGVTALGGGL